MNAKPFERWRVTASEALPINTTKTTSTRMKRPWKPDFKHNCEYGVEHRRVKHVMFQGQDNNKKGNIDVGNSKRNGNQMSNIKYEVDEFRLKQPSQDKGPPLVGSLSISINT